MKFNLKSERVFMEVLCPEKNVQTVLTVIKEDEDGITLRCKACGATISREIGFFAEKFKRGNRDSLSNMFRHRSLRRL